MSVRVEALTPRHEAEWGSFVAEQAEAGLYQGLAWKRVTEEAFGHTARHLCAIDSTDAVVGVLPLFEVTGLFGRRLVSVPMRDRGGVVATSDEAAHALLKAARDLADSSHAKYLEIKRLDPMPEAWTAGADWKVGSGWVTTQVDLTPGHDAVWGALNRKSLRWSINKARKNGVEITSDTSLEGMRAFHELFVKTRCRMGIPPFSWDLFAAIHRHIVEPGLGELLLAHHDGAPVHGLISFYSKKRFVPAYAAPQYVTQKLYANELIFWTSMERALAGGFETYDFGADSERQESLLFFKSRWNGVQRRMHWHYYLPDGGDAPDFDSSGPRYDLVRSVWSKLPHVIARPLGAYVTRQLS